jgi:hypothetical protein
VNVANGTAPTPVIPACLVRERYDLQVLLAVLDRLDLVVAQLAAIEARLSASAPLGPNAGDGKPAADKPAMAEALEKLAHAGLEATHGPGVWPAILGRSRRECDRMRASGRLVQPDFYAGRSPRWKGETVRRWLAAQGGEK